MDDFTPEARIEQSCSTFEFIVPGVDYMPGGGAPGESETGEFDSCVRKAIVSAYEKGLEKGLEEASFWKKKASEELADVVSSVMEGRKAMLATLEGAVLRLSIAIAEKVIKREIQADVRECLKNQIEICLRQLDRDLPVLLRLNPEDVHVVEELLKSEEGSYPELENVRLVEDRRVGRGGCIVETDRGALRATISEQLERISQVLENEYAKSVTREMGATPFDGFED